jgi:MFS family permease
MAEIPRNVSAALAALKFSGARREALQTLNDAEWKDLLWFSDRMQLTIPLWRVCGRDLPGWVRSRIDRNLADNTERFEHIKVAYSNLASALNDARAEHLVLQGFAQWPGFAEHPRFRWQSDIDLYCPPESILRARDALSTLGYEPVRGSEHLASDHLPSMVLKKGREWPGNFQGPKIPVCCELHSCFWDENTARFGPKSLEKFWFRRIERQLDNLRFPGLNLADNLGHSALHLLRDLLRDRLSWHQVYELARFLDTHAEDEPFWKNWRESHDDSLRRFEAISFRLAFESFACHLSEEVQKEVDRLPATTQAWFEEFADSPLASCFRPNKKALWLHLTLVESSRDKRSVLFQGLLANPILAAEAACVPDRTGDEQTSELRPLRKEVRNFASFTSRVAYHAYSLPSTLWHGARWWWSRKNLGREFWTFLTVSFLFDLGMFIFFFLYNLYLVDRGFKENFLGLVAGTVAIGSVAGTIPAGMLAQRVGLRKTLLLCLTLVSLVSALRSVLAAEVPLLAFAFLGGAFSTIWAVSISPAIAHLTNERNRPFGFSLVFSSGIAVGMFGGLVGGRLPGWLARMGPAVTSAGSKQAALLIACGIVALATWPASLLRFASMPVRERKFFPRNPFVFRFLIAIAVWSLVTGSFSPFSNVYFSQYLRMQVDRIGTIFAGSQLSQVLAVLVAPAIFRRFGLISGIMYTQIATAVALGFLATAHGASAPAFVFAGYMAFQWMSEPGMYTLLMNQVSASEQTGASALNFLVISSAQAIAAAAAGASFARFGYPAVLCVIAGVALAAALLFRVLLGKGPLRLVQENRAALPADSPNR